jgi:RNA polymerase-binding protein DksA
VTPTRKKPAKKAGAAAEPPAAKAKKAAPSAKKTSAAQKAPGPAKKGAPAARKAAAAAKKATAARRPMVEAGAPERTPAKKGGKKVEKAGPATKATEKRTRARKATDDRAPKAAAKKTTRAASAARQDPGALRVKADESPWTEVELDEVRTELHSEAERLRAELDLATRELDDLMRDAGDGAGNDQADMGSTTFERDHEMTLANNARVMLTQTEHALDRIADGSYGICESCGQPIGKNRLMAFPRATLCLTCKQREERR